MGHLANQTTSFYYTCISNFKEDEERHRMHEDQGCGVGGGGDPASFSFFVYKLFNGQSYLYII